MIRKEIEKKYIQKTIELKKYNKAYFENDNPIVSDEYYDNLKKNILSL
jgi:NAD-dependent DNA ligase